MWIRAPLTLTAKILRKGIIPANTHSSSQQPCPSSRSYSSLILILLTTYAVIAQTSPERPIVNVNCAAYHCNTRHPRQAVPTSTLSSLAEQRLHGRRWASSASAVVQIMVYAAWACSRSKALLRHRALQSTYPTLRRCGVFMVRGKCDRKLLLETRDKYAVLHRNEGQNLGLKEGYVTTAGVEPAIS
jgi:hypothetical protein